MKRRKQEKFQMQTLFIFGVLVAVLAVLVVAFYGPDVVHGIQGAYRYYIEQILGAV